jgi:hypothetical protein
MRHWHKGRPLPDAPPRVFPIAQRESGLRGKRELSPLLGFSDRSLRLPHCYGTSRKHEQHNAAIESQAARTRRKSPCPVPPNAQQGGQRSGRPLFSYPRKRALQKSALQNPTSGLANTWVYSPILVFDRFPHSAVSLHQTAL